jgi:hypothetical protein
LVSRAIDEAEGTNSCSSSRRLAVTVMTKLVIPVRLPPRHCDGTSESVVHECFLFRS